MTTMSRTKSATASTGTDESPAPTKCEQVLEYLRSDEAEVESLTQREIAERFGCGESTVWRAQEIIRAEKLAAQEGVEPSEAERALGEILRTDQAEEIISKALGEAKDEVKALKGQLKDMQDRGKAARRAARESYPLFDRPEEHSEGEGTANGHQRRLVAVG
jgi:transposase